MFRRSIAGLFLLASPAFAMLQSAETKDLDINGMLAGKKPCDEDKKKADAAPSPKPTPVAQAQTSDKAVQGLMNLGVIPADKQQPEPAKKNLGALPAPMENCK